MFRDSMVGHIAPATTGDQDFSADFFGAVEEQYISSPACRMYGGKKSSRPCSHASRSAFSQGSQVSLASQSHQLFFNVRLFGGPFGIHSGSVQGLFEIRSGSVRCPFRVCA